MTDVERYSIPGILRLRLGLLAACLFVVGTNGFVIAGLRKELQRLRVPCEVLSSAVAPMGEDSFLVRFSVEELIAFKLNGDSGRSTTETAS